MVLHGVVGISLVFALLFAAPVRAQWSGRVGVVSDYRYRGASLSDGEASAQLSVAYDGERGGYAGVLVSSVRFPFGIGADTLILPYAGHAWSLRSGLSVEVGAQYHQFASWSRYDYPEVYAGLSTQRLNARLYYARHYFGDTPTWYAELNSTRELSERFHALAHAGVMRFNGVEDGVRYDLRAGAGLRLAGFDLQLTWGTAGGGRGYRWRYPMWGTMDESTWVVGVSRAW